MARRKETGHGGGHGWFVTFADLMGLLVSFFVMLVAFSTQDQQKLQIVAGSMRDAFGVQSQVRFSGVVEVDGLPTRPKLKNAERVPEHSSELATPDEKERERHQGARLQVDRAFALAAASLRQAMQDMPELAELSKNIMIEETKQGLNIEITDQDGRSMFPEGGKEPYERTRRLVQKNGDRAQGHAEPDHDLGAHRGKPASATPGLWPLGTVGRSRQRDPASPRGRGRAFGPHPDDRGAGRHATAVSRRSLYCGQPAGDDHRDAGRAAVAGRVQAVS
jgi:hypothetical protein